jgi:hypothetical protein
VHRFQRLADHRQRRAVQRVRVHDGVNVVSDGIDMQMKPVSGIRRALAVNNLEVVVDQQVVGSGHLLEAHAVGQCPHGARCVAPRRHLSGEAAAVAVGGEDAAGDGQRLGQAAAAVDMLAGKSFADILDRRGCFSAFV